MSRYDTVEVEKGLNPASNGRNRGKEHCQPGTTSLPRKAITCIADIIAQLLQLPNTVLKFRIIINLRCDDKLSIRAYKSCVLFSYVHGCDLRVKIIEFVCGLELI